jgi:ABC-type siderophore export system fused ATPase/permease subunit
MPCSNQSIQKYFYLFYQEQYSEDTLLKAVEIIIEVLHTKHLPVPWSNLVLHSVIGDSFWV